MSDTTTQVEFPFAGRRTVRAAFDAKPISSDGDALLLRRLDQRLGFLAGLAAVLPDRRDERWVEQPMLDLLRQRVFQIGLGYEDCTDANQLRRDPVLKTCCGRDPVDDADLASQPTFSRWENAAGAKTCDLLGRALLESYFDRHPRRPDVLILDLDTTADPTHGPQEFAAFNAFYDEHVYLPLLIFDGDGDLLTAVLQPGKPQGSRPVVAVLRRVIEAVRRHWPGLRILVRGDSGFASPAMYGLCERVGVEFIIGLGPNARLKALAEKIAERARRRYLRRGRKARLFSSASYRARRRWPKRYRVLSKAEHAALGANLRFVVTPLGGRADPRYDELYLQRAEACENSIKDLKNALHADRLSCHRFWANQFRLLLHAAAYVLMFTLRRVAAGTELASAQMDTLRLRLFKIGVHVERSVRRIWFHLSSSHPWQALWQLLAQRLSAPVLEL